MSEPRVRYKMGEVSYIEVKRLDCADQLDRIEEMQFALYRASELIRLIQRDFMEPRDVRALAFFAELGLESLAESQGGQSVDFASDQHAQANANLDIAQAQIDAWNAAEVERAEKDGGSDQ